MLRVLAFLLAILGAACGGLVTPCFPQSSLVLDPRVLAVRADPPESTLDLSGQEPVVPSSISVLAVDVAYTALLEYGRTVRLTDRHTRLSICLPPSVSDVNAQPGCPDGSEIVGDLPAIPTETNPFVYAPPLALLRQAVASDPVHGLAGVQLRLQIAIDASATTTLTTMKALSYQLTGSPASVNHGLEITGMETSTGGVHAMLANGVTVPLVVAQARGLRPLIGPGPGAADASESYLAYDNSGRLVPLQEHVTYAFYAGNALFFGTPHNGPTAIYTGAPGDVADEPPAGSADPPDGLATVEPVFIGPQAGYFWVIARDGRGAVAWRQVPYAAIDVRSCAQSLCPNCIPHCPDIFFGCE